MAQLRISMMLFCVLTTLSGCKRLIDWGNQTFNQGIDLVYNKELIERYIKSISVYEQGTTLAKFDALWLGDEVRAEYAKIHVLTTGKTDEQYQGLLRRQLEENKHFISFYVLSVYDNPLGSPDSEWRVSLRVNDIELAPTEIKVIELVPEYHLFLNKHINRFRASYRIMFDAKTIDDIALVDAGTTYLELIFRSMKKQTQLRWDIDAEHKVFIPIEDVCDQNVKKIVRKRIRIKEVAE